MPDFYLTSFWVSPRAREGLTIVRGLSVKVARRRATLGRHEVRHRLALVGIECPRLTPCRLVAPRLVCAS